MTNQRDEGPTNAPGHGAADECAGCAGALDRRGFLRGAALAAVASLLAAGAEPVAALTRSVGALTPRRTLGAARSYAIPAADGVSIDAAGGVILVRWQSRVYAFSLRCPHKGAALEWHADERRVFCPKHKARFAPDGAHVSGRGSRPLDRYALTRRGGAILVDTGTVHRADVDRAGWDAAVVALG